MRTTRGFTLVELMIGVVLIGMVGAFTTSFCSGIYRSNKLAEGYVTDLDQCRRALRRVEDDLRATHRVERMGLFVRLHQAAAVVDYRVSRGALERIAGDDRVVVARRIDVLDIDQRGRLAEIKLALMPRAPAPRQRAEVFSAICLRKGSGK